jgi:8-oxo-dGTP pyrophosphatase MutT (NUDIX family)
MEAEMKVRVAAGVLLLSRKEPHQFLLMRHHNRWDLPKGHAEKGEHPRETALREMNEETGIEPDNVMLDNDFEYVLEYIVQYAGDSRQFLKRVHYFLGWVDSPTLVQCTEHQSSQWFRWQPPHQIQAQTIDPLLAAVAKHLEDRPCS